MFLFTFVCFDKLRKSASFCSCGRAFFEIVNKQKQNKTKNLKQFCRICISNNFYIENHSSSRLQERRFSFRGKLNHPTNKSLTKSTSKQEILEEMAVKEQFAQECFDFFREVTEKQDFGSAMASQSTCLTKEVVYLSTLFTTKFLGGQKEPFVNFKGTPRISNYN